MSSVFKNLKLLFLVVSLVTPVFSLGTGDQDSCDCPVLSCDSECEFQDKLDFYTEKCDDGKGIRSCSRPLCLPLDPLPSQCPSQLAANEAKDSVGAALDSGQSRQPASKLAPTPRPEVGVVSNLLGEAKVRSEGEMSFRPLEKNSVVKEMDMIVTESSGRVEVTFKNKNQIYISPNSQIRLTEVVITNNRSQNRVLIQLDKGQTRHKVKENYQGANSFYRVHTGTAVAGVRGTDFVISVKRQAADSMGATNMVTELNGLENSVELMTALGDSRRVLVGEEGIRLVAVGAGRYGELSEQELKKIAFDMSPKRKLTFEEVQRLKAETSFGHENAKKKPEVAEASRRPASSAYTCSSPKGQFGQCAWICENNPRGERVCRTDRPGVNCVRRFCNANGQWASPTRLPSAFSTWCAPEGAIVKDCDY